MTNTELSSPKGFVGSGPYSSSSTFEKSLALRVDGGINAVTIAPSGRDVVMASKHGIYVVDLDDPYQPPRFLEHQTPWQVADVQYSPHLQTSSWVISTSNQKALIWNLMRSAGNAIEHTLHGHSRAITDINWHPQNHNILSTASVDTTVLAWDLREAKRPIYKTADWRASASQVKWNLNNSNVLASSHGNYVSLWDIRKGTKPFIQLNGHTSSVNNISFNPRNEYELISSSNDGTIRVWNYSEAEQPNNYQKQSILADFPVWRGRYLPFGDGFCAIPMVGGNNAVYLASRRKEESSKIAPVYVFKGHGDRITDFLWRSRHQEQHVDDREFQLVTWSKDSDLRLWPIPDSVYTKVNFTRTEKLDTPLVDYPYQTYSKEIKGSTKNLGAYDKVYKFPREKFTTKSGLYVKGDIDHLSWLSGVRVDDQNFDDSAQYDYPDDDDYESLYRNLGEEVAIVGKKLSKVSFEKISVSTGDIVVTLNGPWNSLKKDQLVFIRATLHFDSKYPKRNPPKVRVEESREISSEDRLKIEQKLLDIAKVYIDSRQNCLEPLLRFLLGENVETNPENIKKFTGDIAEYDIMKNLGLDEEDIWNLDEANNENRVVDGESDGSDNDDDDGSEGGNENVSALLPSKKKFDSTPVPKGCGAVFSRSGKLVCFFTSTQYDKQKKLQDKIFNTNSVGMRGFGKVNRDDSDRESVSTSGFDNNAASGKPKTYLEALALKNRDEEYRPNNLFSEIGNAVSEDDWDNILKNDITFRKKISIVSTDNKAITSNQSQTANSSTSSNTVTIKDYTHLIPDKRELALKYRTHGDSLPLVCSHNASVAREYGLSDIATCWEVIGTMLRSSSKDYFKHQDWSYDYDGGKKFLKDVFQFFEKAHNVQMLAMLSCILVASGRGKGKDNHQESMYISCNVSFNSGNIHHSYTQRPSESRDSFMRKSSIFSHGTRSNASLNSGGEIGASNLLPGLKIEALKSDVLDNGIVYYPKTQKLVYNRLNLLDKEQETKCIAYRDQYANLLYCWGFQAERSNILRFNINENSSEEYLKKSDDKDLFEGLEVVFNGAARNRNCRICEEPVLRRSFICNKCGCLTHSECGRLWWGAQNTAENVTCPSGCGCECLLVQ